MPVGTILYCISFRARSRNQFKQSDPTPTSILHPFSPFSVPFPPTRMISERPLISTKSTFLSWIQVSMSTIMPLMKISCVPRDRRSRGFDPSTAILQTTNFSKTLCLAYTLLTAMNSATFCATGAKGGRPCCYTQLLPISSFPPSLRGFFPGSFDLFMDALDRLEVLDRFHAQFWAMVSIMSRSGAQVPVPAVASSSTTISAQGCVCSADSVHK